MSAKFDPAELLQVLVEIARSGARSHITSEFRRCASSFAGSRAIPEAYFHLPADPSSQIAPTTQPTGTSESGRHIEDNWWTAQDRLNDEGAWSRQWENDTDSSDPQTYK